MPGFSADPFKWENASQRAGIEDRDEVARILSEAYARGQLDEAEYEERLDSALQIKLLGEVRPLVVDLGSPKHLLARRDPTHVVAKRHRRQKSVELRNALLSAAGVAAMVNTVYLFTGLSGGFGYYWPMWVMFGLTIYAVTAIIEWRRPPKRAELEADDEV
jgi:uncharacterized membrane protein